MNVWRLPAGGKQDEHEGEADRQDHDQNRQENDHPRHAQRLLRQIDLLFPGEIPENGVLSPARRPLASLQPPRRATATGIPVSHLTKNRGGIQ